jgi:hypothetical protein
MATNICLKAIAIAIVFEYWRQSLLIIINIFIIKYGIKEEII